MPRLVELTSPTWLVVCREGNGFRVGQADAVRRMFHKHGSSDWQFHGNQDFTSWAVRNNPRRHLCYLQDAGVGGILSYKVHVRGKHDGPPPNSRVICFHGEPKPWETKETWPHQFYGEEEKQEAGG